MLDEPVPCLLFDLQAEPFGHALLDPAYQHGGGVGAGDVNRLIGGEQRDPRQRELLFQLQGVVGVTSGALDVLADPPQRTGVWVRRPRPAGRPAPRRGGCRCWVDLAKRIERGEFPVGARLPSEAELAQDYRTAKMTVRRALEILRECGLIRTLHGRGSVVIATP
jgi:hypothetical protein